MNHSLRVLGILAMLGASGLVLAQEADSAAEESSDSAGQEAAAEEIPAETAPAAEVDVDFDGRMGTMEEQVNTLKEQVFRSKATLQLEKID